MSVEGVYLIDKPAGWTSFDVVAYVRKNTGIKTVGHAGTLDPFATGLLIVLVGKENTKKQDDFMKLDKEYEAEIELGKTSTTGDPEGVIVKNEKLKVKNSKKEIETVLREFTGEIEQTPPAHSAIKVNGVRAYKIARSGGEVSLKPRKVTVYSIEIIDYNLPILSLRIKCSSGTYIRSLASDIGKQLGTGGYLKNLRRTRIGEDKAEDAKKISDLEFSL